MLIKLNNIIENTIKNRKIKKKLKESDIINIWKELTGEKIANISRPSRVENNILFVDVISSSWAHEIKFFESKILNDLRNKVDIKIDKIFFNIKFNIENINKDKEEKKENSELKENNKINLDNNDILKINCNLINIKDENIKQKVKEIMIKDKIFKRSRIGDSGK